MNSWLSEQLHVLQQNPSDLALFETTAAAARELGFEYCAYGLCIPLPLSRPQLLMINNYPTEWQNRYRQQNYLAIDPTVGRCCRSSRPVVWSDRLFEPAREFWDEARSFGLRFGWAQSSREPNGTAGMLTFARSEEPLSESELREKEFRMTWLTQIVHSKWVHQLTLAQRLTEHPELSSREVEVLRWTGDGKTSGEISEILCISERTVNYHIGNAATKLNAANKTAAVVRATLLGLLY
jgi:LuxR family transcriptional regulator